jgi:mono/diheme cytochrome c family protein
VLLALCACDWSLHRMQEQPKCTTYAELAGEACALAPPDHLVAWQAAAPARPQRSRALLERGRDRFARLCAPCHGIAGDGDSDVARAMTLRKPPSLVDEKVRGFPDDRLYAAIARGYGLMPSYAGALGDVDRWAVIEFVRALEAREVPLDALSSEQREEALSWLR